MENESKKSAAMLSPLHDSIEGRENLEKIRDLLFGTHMRKLEVRLARMEERLIREMGDVKDGLRQQIDSLEAYVKNELKTVNDRISAEQEKRSEGVKEIKSDLRETTETFDKKTSQVENKVEQYSKDLREQLLDQTKRVTDHLQQKHDEALRVMKESADQIRADYVDRSNLSRMFTQLAVRLDTALAGEIFSAPEEQTDD